MGSDERPSRRKWQAYKAQQGIPERPAFCVPRSPHAIKGLAAGAVQGGNSCELAEALELSGFPGVAGGSPHNPKGRGRLRTAPPDFADDRLLDADVDGFERLEDLAHVRADHRNDDGAWSPVSTESACHSPLAKTPFEFSCIGSPLANLETVHSNLSSSAVSHVTSQCHSPRPPQTSDTW